jgi:hypothetical protein
MGLCQSLTFDRLAVHHLTFFHRLRWSLMVKLTDIKHTH